LILIACQALLRPASAESFHPPATAAEKALDQILKRAGKDDDELDNLLGGRGNKSFHRTVDYTAMLTKPLMAAIAAKEQALVQSECGGQYREGDICGLDYSPITCAQDSNDSHLYRTETSAENYAEVSYDASKDGKAAVTYRLVRETAGWKIDGIRCNDGDLFNFGKP
jgi:hypothetical protein